MGIVAGDLTGGLRGAGVGIFRHDSGAGSSVLDLGSHDQELGEEATDVAEAGEVEGFRAAGVALELMGGAEDRAAAIGAGVGWGEEGLRRWLGDGGGGQRAWAAVAEGCAGAGADEGQDEEGGEDLEDAAGAEDARHAAVRGDYGGVGWRVGGGGHGSFRLGTASHGCDVAGW